MYVKERAVKGASGPFSMPRFQKARIIMTNYTMDIQPAPFNPKRYAKYSTLCAGCSASHYVAEKLTLSVLRKQLDTLKNEEFILTVPFAAARSEG